MREHNVVAASLEPHLSEHAQEQGAPNPSFTRPWLNEQTILFYQSIVFFSHTRDDTRPAWTRTHGIDT